MSSAATTFRPRWSKPLSPPTSTGGGSVNNRGLTLRERLAGHSPGRPRFTSLRILEMPRHTHYIARHGRALLFLICLLLCAAALPRPLTPASGKTAAQTSNLRKLAYGFGGGAGSTDIFVINEDGTGQQRLTLNGVDDRNPTWSPDGSQIAFDS